MTYDDHITEARSALARAGEMIQDEMRAYPTPVSGCDAQYNHLIGLRGSIGEAMRALEGPRFVATPRTPSPMAGMESR